MPPPVSQQPGRAIPWLARAPRQLSTNKFEPLPGKIRGGVWNVDALGAPTKSNRKFRQILDLFDHGHLDFLAVLETRFATEPHMKGLSIKLRPHGLSCIQSGTIDGGACGGIAIIFNKRIADSQAGVCWPTAEARGTAIMMRLAVGSRAINIIAAYPKTAPHQTKNNAAAAATAKWVRTKVREAHDVGELVMILGDLNQPLSMTDAGGRQWHSMSGEGLIDTRRIWRSMGLANAVHDP